MQTTDNFLVLNFGHWASLVLSKMVGLILFSFNFICKDCLIELRFLFENKLPCLKNLNLMSIISTPPSLKDIDPNFIIGWDENVIIENLKSLRFFFCSQYTEKKNLFIWQINTAAITDSKDGLFYRKNLLWWFFLKINCFLLTSQMTVFSIKSTFFF